VFKLVKNLLEGQLIFSFAKGLFFEKESRSHFIA